MKLERTTIGIPYPSFLWFSLARRGIERKELERLRMVETILIKSVGAPEEKQEGNKTRTSPVSVHSKTPFFTLDQRYESSLSVRCNESAVAVDQPRRLP